MIVKYVCKSIVWTISEYLGKIIAAIYMNFTCKYASTVILVASDRIYTITRLKPIFYLSFIVRVFCDDDECVDYACDCVTDKQNSMC